MASSVQLVALVGSTSESTRNGVVIHDSLQALDKQNREMPASSMEGDDLHAPL